MYSTVNNSNVPEYLLGMQISNTIFFFQNALYSNMISGKKKKNVFKYMNFYMNFWCFLVIPGLLGSFRTVEGSKWTLK